MFLKVIVLLLAVHLGLGMLPPRTKSDNNLINFMIDSRAIDSSPELSNYCFNRYLPVLNQLLVEYQTEHNLCLDNYAAACSEIDRRFDSQRQDIFSNVTALCYNFDDCHKLETNLDFFNCFTDSGAEAANVLNRESRKSNLHASEIDALFVQEEALATTCIIRAEDHYDAESTKTYDEFQNCLNGVILPIDPTTSTATTQTTQTTTDDETTAE